jgi:hypothetical protein
MATVLHTSRDLVLAEHEGVFFTLWWAKRVTKAHIDTLGAVQAEYAATHERFGVLVLVDVDRGSGIDADAKEASATQARAMAAQTWGNAQVPLGGRLKAMAARQVMKAQNAWAGSSVPTTVHGSIADAARWLSERSPKPLDAAELAREAERLWAARAR